MRVLLLICVIVLVGCASIKPRPSSPSTPPDPSPCDLRCQAEDPGTGEP